MTIIMLAAARPAAAVVQGSLSSLGIYTVRLVGNGNCTAVAIARRAVVTAAHCARGMHVATGSGSIAIARVSRRAALDDGRRVYVAGDARILHLAASLPFGVSPAPVGAGSGARFTIAGYGTTNERARGAFGALHEASLVAARGRMLVDPGRSGGIGASACFGDSGGPVMRGGVLVGVITRASYPHRRIACGYYTRWAPIRVYGHARRSAARDDAAAAPRRHRHRHARRTRARTTHSVRRHSHRHRHRLKARRSRHRHSARR